jgi:prolyl oligopeptidase
MNNSNRTTQFPAARRDPEFGYLRHGRRFDDPYAWLEELEAPETRAWIAAQEALTRAVLDEVPGRDRLRAAVASSARYPRLSRPIRTGADRREFVWWADADDDRLKLMLRRDPQAPLETVLDPNSWASDEVLVFAVPSPDGALVAFGKAVGSAHGASIRVLDVETGELLPDQPYGRSTGTWPGDRTHLGSCMPRIPSRATCRREWSGTRSTSTG